MEYFKLIEKDNIAFLTFDTKDKAANVLSADALIELKEQIQKIAKNNKLNALVFNSAKERIFVAGADIKEIDSIVDSEDAQAKAKAGQDVLNLIEDLQIPTIALLNGATLGGGLELALAFDYRIASQSSYVKIGLPETKLGIIPGFGGTYRLPRTTGLQVGLGLILQGRVLDAKKAYRVGLVDKLCAHTLLLSEAMDLLKKTEYSKKKPSRNKKFIQRFMEETLLGKAAMTYVAKKKLLQLTRGNYPAPLAAIKVVVGNYSRTRSEAMDIEAKEFAKLIAAGSHKGLIQTFYLMERYKKEKWVDAKPENNSFRKTGVLGAGVMGGGIAQLLSQFGSFVCMKDVSHEGNLLGLRSAQRVFKSIVKRRRLNSAQANAAMARIIPTLNYQGFKQCNLVIEAVVENMEIKKDVFKEVSKVVSKDTVIASNTSALSVSEMAEGIESPERILGMHFFNPVHKMPLVEIIRAEKTSDEAIAKVVNWSRGMNKTPIVVKDSCGFLVNRLLLPYLNEAGYLLEEGVSIEQIDRALLNFGMPMGAFILLDEIGMDVAWKVAVVLENAFGSRMKPCQILKQVADKKWLGKKTGRGFYIHKGSKRSVNASISSLVLNRANNNLSDQQIVDRCLSVMINEASRCLEEGVCRESSDIDVGMLMGAGFPPFRGGLMRYADKWGIDAIVSNLKESQKTINQHRFAPSDRLQEMQCNNTRFHGE